MLKRIMRSAALLLALAWPAAGLAETVEYIHTDALGSPVAITDAAGNVIERTVYEPYGGMVNKAAVDGPGFTGHVADSATGLSYMQQRYYDPQIGRFLSVDPVMAYDNPSGAFNRYWYANNNLYRFTDPDGRQACGKDTDCRLAQGEVGGTIGRIPQASSGRSTNAAPSNHHSPTAGRWDGVMDRLGLKGDLTENGNIFDVKSLAHDVLYPLMDSPGGAGVKAASLGALAITLRTEGAVIFRTGHYASRLEAVGLNVSRTEAVVAREVARIRPNMATGADVVGRMRVNGTVVEYRVRALPDGRVSVGTIFPVK
ncbi:RHS repeat-associated core domain-containing protein [Xanthomonas campestris pv. raphani]|uniref:RHS repeat-associated core domain-containing protein n=1 Tax=Xanthomonas campestris TaxID=339 RepID=UPI00388FEEB4